MSSMFSFAEFNFRHQESGIQLEVGWVCNLREKSALVSIGLGSCQSTEIEFEGMHKD